MNVNTVTISEERFAELLDTERGIIRQTHDKFMALQTERDELKAKLDALYPQPKPHLQAAYSELKKERDDLQSRLAAAVAGRDARQHERDEERRKRQAAERERDELREELEAVKHNLEINWADWTSYETLYRDADRCIDDVLKELSMAVVGDSIGNVKAAKKIIRSYREKKEAK